MLWTDQCSPSHSILYNCDVHWTISTLLSSRVFIISNSFETSRISCRFLTQSCSMSYKTHYMTARLPITRQLVVWCELSFRNTMLIWVVPPLAPKTAWILHGMDYIVWNIPLRAAELLHTGTLLLFILFWGSCCVWKAQEISSFRKPIWHQQSCHVFFHFHFHSILKVLTCTCMMLYITLLAHCYSNGLDNYMNKQVDLWTLSEHIDIWH